MNSLYRKQARKIFLFFMAAWLGLSQLALRADPTGPEILAGVRKLVQTQNATLQGQLRTDGVLVPFTLQQSDGVSVYQFTNPPETVKVTFSDDGSTLTGVDDPQKNVRGSVLTYNDLALSFLYWKDIQNVGSEKIRGLPCWELRLAPPNRKSTYSVVHLWVNIQSGAFLRADAYDWTLPTPRKVRNFEVTSTQKINGNYVLKQMRITDLVSDGKPFSYLEILPPKE